MLEFTFACYYPGKKPLFIPVDISLDVWVAKFPKVIYDELDSQGREVTRQDPRLKPKEDLQQQALQWFHQQSLDSHLDPMARVKSKFPNGPNLSDDELHILVVDTVGMFSTVIHAILRSGRRLSLSGAPAALFNPALAILQRNLGNLEQVEISPFDVGHASQYLRYATKFYKEEVQCQRAIMELIEEATGIKPDCCWWYRF